MVFIAPSVLSADFTHLARHIRDIETGGADWIHLDIMDGHFVPNISFGPMVVKAIRSLTKLPLDAHLMIADPDAYLGAFGEAGADRITVHAETCPHLHRTVGAIRALGMKPGVTLNPATPLAAIGGILPFVDLVLIMTVNPGFGGQKFIPGSLGKIGQAAALIRETGRDIRLQVDGGVDAGNVREIVEAGADVIVAGNSIFSHRDIPSAVRRLRKAAGS
ncbi:MAG TPA: ribulose-phosphate 3-epimerase [Bacteroidota bacterium]|nr:ribulose-phosphate 3-epimerase [Bacteroidota bacterium]